MPSQPSNNQGNSKDYFDLADFDGCVDRRIEKVTALYLADDIPWVLGYSGGKDSTAVLELVWMSLARMPAKDLHKHVYVITNDTLVENPIVASWVAKSLDRLDARAAEEGLPITAHRLFPAINETYWVNLIGRGYPAPRPKFRWCTERMKIKPSNRFISEVVREHGEAIVVLGTRRAESAARAHVLDRLGKEALREDLRPHTMLPNSYVYSPIEDWTNEDVWTFLGMVENPWGIGNDQLLELYRGANPDRECPVVVEEGTPSCGDSRFGCWVCTLVEQDKSMAAMIKNDEEKKWMAPLLALRDELIPRDEDGFPQDRHLRDFRRMHGNVDLMGDQHVPGPYTQPTREEWLRRVLEAQIHVRANGPADMGDLQLISPDELREIRRIWVNEKHEIEDSLPQIYEAVTGEAFPDEQFTEDLPIGADEIDILRKLCGEDSLHFQLTRELISIERQHRHLARRSGLFGALEKSFRRNFFDDADDATSRAKRLKLRIETETAAIDINEFVESRGPEPLLPGFDAEQSEPEAQK